MRRAKAYSSSASVV